LIRRVQRGMTAWLAMQRQTVRVAMAGLDSLSPLAVLGRGYSIVQTVPDGVVVKRARDVSEGDRVRARLGEGELLCDVQKILPDA